MSKEKQNQTKKKSKIKQLREWWKIPRYRSCIILALYGIFFLSLYLYVQVANVINENKPSENIQEKDALTSLSEMDNYEYDYTIDYLTNTNISNYQLEGIRYQAQDNFKLLNHEFYIENDTIHSSEEVEIATILQIDLLLLKPDKLYKYINLYTDANKIIYQDGEIKTTYEIKVSDFNITYLEEIPLDNSDVIKLITYEKNNQIYKLELDILSLMKLVNPSLQSYQIEINYSNINNIKEYKEISNNEES